MPEEDGAGLGEDVGAVDLGRDELGEDVLKLVYGYKVALEERGVRIRSLLVFGSRARGDYKPWSDIDVVVVAENLPKVKRWEILWVGEVEPRGYTPEEFLEALWRLDLTALDACDEGRVIYDDGFWQEARGLFERVKEFYGLRKVEDGWQVTKLTPLLK